MAVPDERVVRLLAHVEAKAADASRALESLAGGGGPTDMDDMARMRERLSVVEGEMKGAARVQTATLAVVALLGALSIGLVTLTLTRVDRVESKIDAMPERLEVISARSEERARETTRAFSDALMTAIKVLK